MSLCVQLDSISRAGDVNYNSEGGGSGGVGECKVLFCLSRDNN